MDTHLPPPAPAMELRPAKPLGAKAYGSIPHLPGSRMGPGDHHCHEGQARIATLRSRDRHDLVTVQEKLDGSCVAVARIDNEVVSLGRAGHLASSSRHEMHQLFAAWVEENGPRFKALLTPGERVVGEWLAQAHGTRYELTHEPFVAFDLMVGRARATVEEVTARVTAQGFVVPHVIHVGPLGIDAMQERLGLTGFHGATDRAEGAVWRVERKGVVDFLVKWVRPDKTDGCYLPEIVGGSAVWNWRPAA